MNVDRIMQRHVATVTPQTSVRAVAAVMETAETGFLPVCEGGRPVGVITDRDIVLRLMSKTGAATDVPVGEIMSKPVIGCRRADSVAHAAGIMGDHQVRRLLVLEEDGTLLGLVSLGDIARDASEVIAGEALGEIVECR